MFGREGDEIIFLGQFLSLVGRQNIRRIMSLTVKRKYIFNSPKIRYLRTFQIY